MDSLWESAFAVLDCCVGPLRQLRDRVEEQKFELPKTPPSQNDHEQRTSLAQARGSYSQTRMPKDVQSRNDFVEKVLVRQNTFDLEQVIRRPNHIFTIRLRLIPTELARLNQGPVGMVGELARRLVLPPPPCTSPLVRPSLLAHLPQEGGPSAQGRR